MTDWCMTLKLVALEQIRTFSVLEDMNVQGQRVGESEI